MTHNDKLRSISPEDAKLILIAVRRIADGSSPELVMDSLCSNLGIEKFGADDKTYDPLVHVDVVGGMKPGEKSTTLRSGWKLNGRVLRRAEVVRG